MTFVLVKTVGMLLAIDCLETKAITQICNKRKAMESGLMLGKKKQKIGEGCLVVSYCKPIATEILE